MNPIRQEDAQRLKELNIEPSQVLSKIQIQGIEHSFAFVSGSIVEGYGNAESDLDVFCIHPEGQQPEVLDYQKEDHFIAIEYTQEWRIDTEFWTIEKLQSLAKAIAQCDATDWDQVWNLKQSDLELAHCIRVGLPLQGEEQFYSLQDSYDFVQLSRILKTRQLSGYTGAADDTMGAIGAKQRGAALLNSRRALGIAIDAWIASQGETNSKVKWRFSKLEKLGNPQLLEQYWQLETPSLKERSEILGHAEKVVAFAEEIILELQ